MFHPCNFFQHLISTSFSTVYNSFIASRISLFQTGVDSGGTVPTHPFVSNNSLIAFEGLFPAETIVYKPYVTPESLLADLQAYKIHASFPINSAVAELRKSQGIAFTKVIPCRSLILHRWTVAKPQFSRLLTRPDF
jgi:hypothetical protein